MNAQPVMVGPITWRDLPVVTRMTFDNMTGVDRYFTRMVRNPLGRWFTYLTLPIYLRFSGQGYKVMVDGRIAACGFLHLRRHSGYIFNISVSRPYRRRGLGRRLMVFLEQATVRQGYGWAVLQVDHGNEPAERLYSQLGYRPYHPHFLRRDERPPIGKASTAGVSIERLGRYPGRQLFRRYRNVEREKGDFWAAAVVEEYDSWSDSAGDFWRCQLYDREIGCAQVLDRDGRPLIRLAQAPDYWGHLATGGLIKKLVDTLPGRPVYVDLFLESSAHHREATPILNGLGFRERFHSRIFMLKALDGAAGDGDGSKPGAGDLEPGSD